MRREPMKSRAIPPAVCDAAKVPVPVHVPAIGQDDRSACLAMSGATAVPMLEVRPPADGGPALGPAPRGQRSGSGGACRTPCGAPQCLAGCRRRWPTIL